jgi:TfoX/Sxy family transcriptional regulator of competence genes
MAYDEDLAQRVREQLAGKGGVTEKAMFGGFGFLLGGDDAGLALRVQRGVTCARSLPGKG